MSRLIDAVWIEEKFKKALDAITAQMADSVMSEDDENIKAGQNQYSAYATALTILKHAPTIEAVPLSEIYRLVAGHSNYHGDSILAAMTCITEGKEVKPIRPIEAVPVVHGEWILVSQWKDEDGVINPIYRCSACHIPNDEKDSFCKHCGAKMKGGAMG